MALAAFAGVVLAQSAAESFRPEQISAGSATYVRNCAPCHGPRMKGGEAPVKLLEFPRDERERFIASVTNGKNAMPPWRGLLTPEDIEALWAYVVAGEKD